MIVLSVRLSVAQRILGDDELLDIRRSLNDLVGLRVTQITLHGKLRRVAVGPEDLQGRVRVKGDGLGRRVLRYRGLQGVGSMLIGERGGAVDEQARRLFLDD